MSDYQKYLNQLTNQLRDRSDAIIIVSQGGGWTTFGNDAVIVASRLNKPIKKVNSHRTVRLTNEDLDKLMKAQDRLSFV